MTDILFRCEKCGKHMCGHENRIGKVFACPDCGAPVDPPSPALLCSCPSCGDTFAAPASLSEQDFLCPSCEAVMRIPTLTTIACPKCSVGIEIDSGLLPEIAGHTVACPQCGQTVSIPVLPAAHPSTAKGLPSGFGQKTVRLDEFIESIPQARLLEAGRCPYCNREIERHNDHTYVCRSCGRMIHTIRQNVRRS